MEKQKFIQNNQSFICIKCSKSIDKHPSSSRDHCNYCLTGLHVDIFPGDRANPCRGILEPIGILSKNSKTQIVYKCLKCQNQIQNIIAPDDNSDYVQELYKKVW